MTRILKYKVIDSHQDDSLSLTDFINEHLTHLGSHLLEGDQCIVLKHLCFPQDSLGLLLSIRFR
jgi:hypothetical protein